LKKICLLFGSGIVVAVLAWSTVSAQQRSAPRQGWEYKSMVYTIAANGVGSLVEEGKPSSSSPTARAPQIGAEGWEMTGFSSVPNIVTNDVTGRITSTMVFVYWFKRPL
jgi:hypothetical protein